MNGLTDKDVYERRKFSEIRNQIQASLTKRPMSCDEISNDITADWHVVSRHLEWLEEMNVIRPRVLNYDKRRFKKPIRFVIWEINKR